MSHREISLTKSAIRIIGYMFLMVEPFLGVGVLVLAEILGILEEKDQA